MGLFKSKEEKSLARQRKREEKLEKFRLRYNLDSIDSNDLDVVERIANDLAGLGLMKTGMALSFGKAEEQAKIGYSSAQVEQNWLIINQLSRINERLEELIETIENNK